MIYQVLDHQLGKRKPQNQCKMIFVVAESLNIHTKFPLNSSSLPTTKTVKIKKEICCSNEKVIKDSSQIPQNKSLNIFHQKVRGLGNKTNELYCHLHCDLPHILCLSEHHLSESELQLTHLTNYSLGASYCRKNFS